MFVEKQERYPRGTYRVRISMRADNTRAVAGFHLVNLATGRHASSGTIWNLVRFIDEDIQSNKYPQSEIKYRSWGVVAPGAETRSEPPGKDAAGSEGPTFVVQVLFRQNATWQGTVQWLEGRQTRQYRSVNELLRLIGEAVEFTQAAPAAEVM